MQYALRRIQRIYPVFLFVLALYLALSLLFPAQSKLPDEAMAAILYVVANILLLPGLLPIDPIITVSWSLSYEVFYYTVVPIVVGVLFMRRWPSANRLAFFLLVYLGVVAAQWYDTGEHFRFTTFLGGMILYELSPRPSELRRRPWLDWLSLAMFALALLGVTLLGDSRWVLEQLWSGDVPGFLRYVLLKVAIVFLVYRCLYASGTASRLFAFAPLRWFGNISYSYYLMHSLGLHVFFAVLAIVLPALDGSLATFTLLVAPALILTIIASMPVFLLIERPLSLRPAGRIAAEPGKAGRIFSWGT